MTDAGLDLPAPVKVVVADANVLFSRSLRDYLLIAAEQEIIEVCWSPRIPWLVGVLAWWEGCRRLGVALAEREVAPGAANPMAALGGHSCI